MALIEGETESGRAGRFRTRQQMYGTDYRLFSNCLDAKCMLGDVINVEVALV